MNEFDHGILETVVLRRWERSKQKFGFIKRVHKGEITTVKERILALFKHQRERPKKFRPERGFEP